MYHWRNFARFFITQFFFNNLAAGKRWMMAKVCPFLFVEVYSQNKDITPKCFLNWIVCFIFKKCVSQPKFVFVVTWWFQKNTKHIFSQRTTAWQPPPLFPASRSVPDSPGKVRCPSCGDEAQNFHGGSCSFSHAWVVVSNIFYFHLYLGKISNLTNIFQMGWNHQLVILLIEEILNNHMSHMRCKKKRRK